MNVMRTMIIGAGAALTAAAASVIVFLGAGIFAPTWFMAAIYGAQATEDSPGHGAVLLLITLPLAGILSIITFAALTITLYRYLADWLTKGANTGR